MKKLKANWKVVVTIAVILVAIGWAANSLYVRSYSGTDLDFAVGSGPIKLTNPSDSALPVKLVAETVGTFTVWSDVEEISGRSISQGTGSSKTQLYEFALPPGETELRIVHGKNIHFVADTDTSLKATMQPLKSEDSQSRLGIAAFIVLVSLFYLSYSNDHRWISASRRQKAVDQAAAQEAERQEFSRFYNRTASSDKS